MIKLYTPDEWDMMDIHHITVWLKETFKFGWRWSTRTEYPEPYQVLYVNNEADAMLIKLKFGFV